MINGIGRFLALAGCLMLAGCGMGSSAGGDAAPLPSGVPEAPTVVITHGPEHGRVVEPFRVRNGTTEWLIYAHSYCYAGGCADGADNDPPQVGSPPELYVYVPANEFNGLWATQFRRAGDASDPGCGRHVASEVSSLGGGWWSIRPRGPAGDYTVVLHAARTEAGGSSITADVRWRTLVDHPLPDPVASLYLIAEEGGKPTSHGLDLSIINLAEPHPQASATITVTASNGRSLTFEAERPEGCWGEGVAIFSGPDEKARQAAALGDFPFTIRVELVLDGATYVATAVYPDDMRGQNSPELPLQFDPPLR